MGYVGQRMSERAIEAYENGEKPLSKWTKSEIIDTVTTASKYFNSDELKKYSKKTLASVFLYRSSWHHTGKYYACTDFYSLNEETLEDRALTIKKCKNVENYYKEEAQHKKEEKLGRCYQRVKFHYLEWSGTKKHPIAEDIEAYGYLFNGTIFYKKYCKVYRKMLCTRGVYIIEKYEMYTNEEVRKIMND